MFFISEKQVLPKTHCSKQLISRKIMISSHSPLGLSHLKRCFEEIHPEERSPNKHKKVKGTIQYKVLLSVSSFDHCLFHICS